MNTVTAVVGRLGIIIALAAVAGCATSNFTYGRDFPAASVGQIVKGKTTAAEVTQWFGEPFQKTTLAGGQENWMYTYSSSTAHAQSYIFVTNVQSSGTQKTLSLVLDQSIVTSFTFSQSGGPNGAGTTTVP